MNPQKDHSIKFPCFAYNYTITKIDIFTKFMKNFRKCAFLRFQIFISIKSIWMTGINVSHKRTAKVKPTNVFYVLVMSVAHPSNGLSNTRSADSLILHRNLNSFRLSSPLICGDVKVKYQVIYK